MAQTRSSLMVPVRENSRPPRRAASAWIMLAGCSLLAGCLFNKKESPASQPAATQPLATPIIPQPVQEQQKDAIPEQQYIVQVMIYRITLPAGAVSGSEEFWKHIDEHALDVTSYETLYKNGLRVGVGVANEWSYLKSILDQYPAMTQPSGYTGREAKDIELEMKLKVEQQNIFYFSSNGELVGRSYDRADNLLKVSFQPAPRKHGSVRLTICPVVRSMREVLVPIGEIHTRTNPWIRPEFLYDLNLVADVSIDNFLVLAPSPEGRWSTSLGSTFFTTEGKPEKTESMLVFKPIVWRQKEQRKESSSQRR